MAKAKVKKKKEKEGRPRGLCGMIFPPTRTFKIPLEAGGTAVIQRKCLVDTVLMKCKLLIQEMVFDDFGQPTGMIEEKLINARDGKRRIIVAPYKVDTVQLTMSLPGGKKCKSRSCCKTPDIFDVGVGTELALKHLFHALGKGNTMFTAKDRKAIKMALCPQKYPQPKTDADASQPSIPWDEIGHAEPAKKTRAAKVKPATTEAAPGHA